MRPYFDRDRSLLKLLLTTAVDAVRQEIAATCSNNHNDKSQFVLSARLLLDH